MAEQLQKNEEQKDAVLETKACSLCEKPIELAKIRLHEMGCARMNYKCPDCGQIVPKSDREQHKEECGKPEPVEQPIQSQPQQQQQPQPSQTMMQNVNQQNDDDLQKCLYCPMEFTASQIENHIAYCGSKTKECPDCYTAVQAWLMTSHKDTGECANIVLDRQEANDENQIRQVIERSAFDDAQPPSISSAQQQPVIIPNQAVDIPSAASGDNDDGIDENEREIARILQEEMKQMEGGNPASANHNNMMQDQNDNGYQNMNQVPAGGDDGGYRAPDEQRMQCLNGPDPYNPDDYGQVVREVEEEQRRLQQQRINQGIVTGIGSGIMSAAGAVASGFGQLFGMNAQQQQQQQQRAVGAGGLAVQNSASVEGVDMSEDERQMQLAMAASMMQEPEQNANQANQQQSPQQMQQNVQQQPVIQNLGDNQPGLGGVGESEDEAMARAIAESMNQAAVGSTIEQIQARNDIYQQQMAQGFEDEDAMIARALAESQNQQ